MKVYLEYKDEKSNKFWQIEVVDNSCIINYGKIGSKARQSIKNFADEQSALKEAKKQIEAKKKKGYSVVTNQDTNIAVNSEQTKTQKLKVSKKSPAQIEKLADDFLKSLQDWGQLYPQFAGCEIIWVNDSDIISRGKNRIYPDSGDWLVYDKRCFEGTYGLSHDDYSITNTKIKNPSSFGVDYEKEKIKRALSTKKLIRRYTWVSFMFITWQHIEFTNPYYYDFDGGNAKDSTEKLNKAFEKEFKTFEDDPYLALYWLIHFGFSCDYRYELVKDRVLDLNLGEKLEYIDQAIAFFEKYDEKTSFNVANNYSKEQRENLFLVRRANLIWISHSYALRGGIKTFENWWLSVALAPKADKYMPRRVRWLYRNLDKFDVWDKFDIKLKEEKIDELNPEISLLSYVLAMNPNKKNKTYLANKFLEELNQNQQLWRDDTSRSFVQIMLWDLRGYFGDISLLEKMMNYYFNKCFESDEYKDLLIAHFGENELNDQASTVLKKLQENIKNSNEILSQCEAEVLEKVVKIANTSEITYVLITFIFTSNYINKKAMLLQLFSQNYLTMHKFKANLFEFIKNLIKDENDENIDVILYLIEELKEENDFTKILGYAFCQNLHNEKIFSKLMRFLSIDCWKNMDVFNEFINTIFQYSSICFDSTSEYSFYPPAKCTQKQMNELLDTVVEKIEDFIDARNRNYNEEKMSFDSLEVISYSGLNANSASWLKDNFDNFDEFADKIELPHDGKKALKFSMEMALERIEDEDYKDFL